VSYGRAVRAGAAAALKASPIGGIASKAGKLVSGLFGGGTPGYSKSLRETRAAARSGDVALLRFKLANSKYWQVRKAANQALMRLGNQSQSMGAAPKGLMVGRKPVSRSSSSTRRRSSSTRKPARKRSSARRSKSGWVLYKGRRYSPKQARIFVPRKRR